jgi:hypothetical protein
MSSGPKHRVDQGAFQEPMYGARGTARPRRVSAIVSTEAGFVMAQTFLEHELDRRNCRA